ncbi:MAG: STAS-like domain-containing protein [Methylobacter sp.]
MYIVVKSFTDLKTPQPCHGKKLARLARECFANHQTLTVDFEGVQVITQVFFQELVLPLVAEFGAGFLKNKFQLSNVTPEIDEIMKSAFNNLDDYFERHASIHNKACDAEIYELNLTWLIKARELARENAILGELMMGIAEEDMRLAISQLSNEDIQHIAQSGWLCFSPRFTTEPV